MASAGRKDFLCHSEPPVHLAFLFTSGPSLGRDGCRVVTPGWMDGWDVQYSIASRFFVRAIRMRWR